MAIKIQTDSGPPIFTKSGVVDEPDPEPEVAAEPKLEPTVVDEPELEVAAESEPEIRELLVGTLADLPAELVMELVSSTPAVRVPVFLRLFDAYDPLQILLKATCSHECGFLVVQNTIGPVFDGEDLPRHVACVLFEVSIAGSWS